MNKTKILRRIERLKGQAKKYQISEPQKKFNYFGGYDYGYIMGKIAILEEMLDEDDNENLKTSK